MPQLSIFGNVGEYTSLRIALIRAALSFGGNMFLPFFVNMETNVQSFLKKNYNASDEFLHVGNIQPGVCEYQLPQCIAT